MKLSFGKGGGKKKKKGDTKPKSSKRKSSGGGDGLAKTKDLVIQHGEKAVIAMVVVGCVGLVYSGFRTEKLQSDPEQIQVAISDVRSYMTQNTWPEVRDQRYPEPDNFQTQATQDTAAVDPDQYAVEVPFFPPLKERQKQRPIPELAAPAEIVCKAGYGAVAVRGQQAGSETSRFTGINDDSRPIPEELRRKLPGETSVTGSTVESQFFVSVTGLVPVKKQRELFDQAFQDAADYNPERDQPIYLALDVRRREVGPDGQPGQWNDLDALRVMKMVPNQWDAQLQERAASEYVIDSLVMRLPPILFRDMTVYALHPKIPREQQNDEGFIREEPGAERTQEDEAFDIFEDLRGPSIDEQGSEETQPTEASYAREESQIQVDRGLLRYFDFDVEPGKTYEYQVQLWLEDPNNPRQQSPPSNSAMTTDAIIYRQQNPDKKYIESPWSDPSSPVTVPTGQVILAGSVEYPRTVGVGPNRSIEIVRPGDEPEGRVMAVSFDQQRAMEVPAEVEVYRGSIVNGQFDTEAIDPTEAKVTKLSDYRISTGAIVLDMAGGQLIDGIRAPGEVLVMDSAGYLTVHNERIEFQKYDLNKIPEEEDLDMDRRAMEGGDEEGRDERPDRRRRNRRGPPGRGEEFGPMDERR